MQKMLGVGILAIILFMVGTAGAETIYLTKADNDIFDGKISIQADLNGEKGTITVQCISHTTSYEPLRINNLYYNLASNPVVSVDCEKNIKNKGVATITDFGEFDNLCVIKTQGGGTSNTYGVTDPITFTLNESYTSIPSNVNGHSIAVHVLFGDGTCTSVTNGNTNNNIPEFPTMALPVMAILGILFVSQREREKKE
ncbi:PEF-CTERM sorting domain-containing protein [Methanosarcina sp. Mfa9]|uniref:PEF-CTERM sorting domain-containing protein n=1 Tax=Methanosarcina sp. Mfa9 TaxID=3439063 RepID=UPI003F854BF0